MAEGVKARAAAVAMLDAVLGEGRMLTEAADAGLPPEDRARALRLASAVLRRLEPADHALAVHLRKRPALRVMNILRLAVVERAMGAPGHGVVNAAVAIARSGKKTTHMAGLVNAVLRAVPEGPLPTVQKLPRWLRQPMVHAYGREAVTAIEAVHAVEPPLDLSLRAGAEAPEGQALSTGSLRLSAPGQVSNLPGYAKGGWWVQDAAAALPAKLLDAQKGERVLDLCAAPGGKTMQLAATGAEVTALDLSEARLKRLRENLARTDLKAEVIAADALTWQPTAPFDAILLDAPCSATGTIRRHPDLPFVKDETELATLVTLQAQLVDRAVTWLKPGGRLVFSTCSLLPAEGEDQLSQTLARHPKLSVERMPIQGVEDSWWTEAGGLRTRPDFWGDQGGMDGFFMARFRLNA
ncbi:transcription antitermination factor NusB [Xinfangfangia sp. CPCC 101601]|uniref:Transcription antitermination factor NusB n=1 Tax=Pseudogemmobacter lacusdianii TaxID=3069608 RepID=A0ABU0VWY7_9RHOB|nr:transcription antitermination factor NusB [Xinfangfangia sp. CPCC 101601]MDQ2066257.1 transcription antitermination factor NusB [Xinfangfangia sp. CPCC 101601]